MSNIRGEGLEEAQRVIRKAYYEGVSADAADLVRGYFDGEYDDVEARDERVQEMADQHVTYTADQWTTLYASDNVDAGMDRAEDLGYTNPENNPGGRRNRATLGVDQNGLLAVWAYGAYEADLREVISNRYGVSHELVESAMELGLDSDQRLLWLAGRTVGDGEGLRDQGVHRYLMQTDDGSHAFLVGTVHPQQQGEVDLGVVVVSVTKGAPRAGRETTRSFFNSLFNGNAPSEVLQLAQLVSDGDAGAWAPLSDMMQEVHDTVLGMEPVFELTTEGNTKTEFALHQVLAEYVEQGMTDDEVLVAALEMKAGESMPLGGGAQPTSLLRRVR